VPTRIAAILTKLACSVPVAEHLKSTLPGSAKVCATRSGSANGRSDCAHVWLWSKSPPASRRQVATPAAVELTYAYAQMR
jgi:hypothetical protein